MKRRFCRVGQLIDSNAINDCIDGIASNAYVSRMATLTIRNLDDRLKTRLRVRAAEHGKSMEEEAREILKKELAVAPGPAESLVDVFRRRFGPENGVDLEIPPRGPMREPPTFE